MKLKLAAIAVFALVATALPASAEEGPWRVGQTYVVRQGGLDLQQPDDRRRLLEAIESAATRACKSVGTRGARRACEAERIEHALARAPHAREAIIQARLERDDTRFASR